MRKRSAPDQAEPGDDAPAAPPPPPSPVWYGAIASVSLLVAVLWLLGYTLLDLGWQQSLGGWNYLIAFALSTVMGQMLQHWHGDPRRE